MTNFEGDPKLYDAALGAEIIIRDGQPVIDEGLENAVYLSLFVAPGWWGNSLAKTDAEKLGSNFLEISRRNLTNKTRLDAQKAAESALDWMVQIGVASKITVTATIPEPSAIGVTIKIEQPGKTSTVKYKINWQAMASRVGAS